MTGTTNGGDVRAMASALAQEAVEKLAEWMRCDDAKTSLAACSALLDRAAGKPGVAAPEGPREIKVEFAEFDDEASA